MAFVFVDRCARLVCRTVAGIIARAIHYSGRLSNEDLESHERPLHVMAPNPCSDL